MRQRTKFDHQYKYIYNIHIRNSHTCKHSNTTKIMQAYLEKIHQKNENLGTCSPNLPPEVLSTWLIATTMKGRRKEMIKLITNRQLNVQLYTCICTHTHTHTHTQTDKYTHTQTNTHMIDNWSVKFLNNDTFWSAIV